MSTKAQTMALAALKELVAQVESRHGFFSRPVSKHAIHDAKLAIIELCEAIDKEKREAQAVEQFIDLMTFGTSISKDGKRIDPEDVFKREATRVERPLYERSVPGVVVMGRAE